MIRNDTHPNPVLKSLIDELPKPGESWSKARRDLWLSCVTAVLDFFYPVTEEGDEPHEVD